ncbi:hypothetical protein Xmau_00499 [Xenorhabdus mauleonii]|uniref:Lipoprotein n=1 Tax=Xenorhabdus mauleonii TaxID=351675 RepID=A0A1I3J5C1_9GAMM|nr:hypothetical protein [Xenorhabdus mauleonii]PHM46103.1 hypothetical protein Xmau_00499 [Xenorhabdus mauleonii]SFI55521.1 hypothetical protein SAMN05421680_10294 [Xenorhabdus mauleonii]
MKIKLTLFLGLSISLLSGCDLVLNTITDIKDELINKIAPFNPPATSKWIEFEGILPKNTKPRLTIEYISNKCLNSKFSFSSSPYNVFMTPKHHYVNDINISADPTTRIFKKKIPIDGGGWCDWKVKTINLALDANNQNYLGKGAELAAGVGINVTVIDHDDIQELPKYINDNIIYNTIIYPFLIEYPDKSNKIGLYGKTGVSETKFQLKLNENEQGKISYNPILDESKMPIIIISENEEQSKVVYPSGRIEKGKRLNYDLIK